VRAASAADTISACVSRIAAAGGCDELSDDEDDEDDDDAEKAPEKAEAPEEEDDEEDEAADRRQKPPCASSGRSSGTSECANRASERLRDERAAALRCTVECCHDEGEMNVPTRHMNAKQMT
jgi:outer membrane biosynthesis protein TonB